MASVSLAGFTSVLDYGISSVTDRKRAFVVSNDSSLVLSCFFFMACVLGKKSGEQANIWFLLDFYDCFKHDGLRVFLTLQTSVSELFN